MVDPDSEKPVENDDSAPPAPTEMIVYNPRESIQEPPIQVITTRRFSSGRMTFESVQQISLAKISFWLVVACTLLAASLGFILGAVLGAIEIARISAMVVALLLGSLTGILALRVGLSAKNARSGLLSRI